MLGRIAAALTAAPANLEQPKVCFFEDLGAFFFIFDDRT